MMRRLIARYLIAAVAGVLGLGCAEAKFYSPAGAHRHVAPEIARANQAAGSPDAYAPMPSVPAYQEPTGQNPPPAAAQTPQEEVRAQLAAGIDSSQPAGERILIYTANLQVSSADVEASLAAAQKLCTDVGGYMDAMTATSITMRVPAQEFFTVLEEVRKLGQVLLRNISAQDVTDEYVDLRLRLKNAEVTRDHLLAILEKAQTVKDTLEVERELSRVREDIERIKGRLTVLDRQTAFSTITIAFLRPAPVEIRRNRPPTPFAWLDALGVEHVLQLDH